MTTGYEAVQEFWNPFQTADGEHVLEIDINAVETPVVHVEPEWIVVETSSSIRRFSIPHDSMVTRATATVRDGRLRIALPHANKRASRLVPAVQIS